MSSDSLVFSSAVLVSAGLSTVTISGSEVLSWSAISISLSVELPVLPSATCVLLIFTSVLFTIFSFTSPSAQFSFNPSIVTLFSSLTSFNVLPFSISRTFNSVFPLLSILTCCLSDLTIPSSSLTVSVSWSPEQCLLTVSDESALLFMLAFKTSSSTVLSSKFTFSKLIFPLACMSSTPCEVWYSATSTNSSLILTSHISVS